jgi:hypothetical protein
MANKIHLEMRTLKHRVFEELLSNLEEKFHYQQARDRFFKVIHTHKRNFLI